MPNVVTDRFRFANRHGHELDARLELPVGGPAPATALFAHCFTCTKDSHAARRITAALAARGFAVLRFDFTGLGDSDGEFANSGFVANVEDLVSAADHLREQGMAPSLLIGHSLGGAAVIAAAEAIPEVSAVATIGAPYEVHHVLHQLGNAPDTLKDEAEVEVTIGGRPFKIGREFVNQALGQPQAERLHRLDAALLVMHAPSDAIVGIENATDIFIAAKHPKSFVSLNDADHLLLKDGAASYAAHVITAWAEPYVPVMAKSDEPLEEGLVSVETAGGKFAQIVRTAAHEFVADEPLSIGGTDLGPTPYDLLLAGLGACTSMTIRMYADRKKLALDSVKVVLEHGREHAADCSNPGVSRRIDVIDRTIELRGDLSAEQREKLLTIAEKCPVHRTLENRIEVRTIAV
ncbi:bifunctional alpha/beta hydrolase/OsmC family protein [Croceicoccus sp. F390]|uniref:Bifunctional alpha/beta hydrolase/OsmC family protein n=1 Tax=Croceicoccus esteveae TaxID=3075597 RepID=A0ABU2ZKP5_9SPHN|nr:bifunctional alpha/beta hydrolase/OsmC family protein [Croceicoccus sp. F390]MDT0576961.1 bifunctional alpha/beta hydrolase/OsmC family protein [Croceicoccus sp. F390]